MTRRRNFVAGGTYLIERRCAEPWFYTPKIPELRTAFLYCLANASSRYDVAVNAYVVQPDRWRGVVTPKGENLSQFLTWFHQFISKCVRSLLGSDREVWSARRAKVTPLSRSEETIEAIAEVLGAPAVGWIDDDENLIELRSAVADYSSAAHLCERQSCHFRLEGFASPEAALDVVLPPGLAAALTEADLHAAIRERTGGTPAPVHLVNRDRPTRQHLESTGIAVPPAMPLERMMELWCSAGTRSETEET